MRIPTRVLAAFVALVPLVAPGQAHATGGGTAAFAGFLTYTAPCFGCPATFDSVDAEGAVLSTVTGPLVVFNVHADISYSDLCTNAAWDGVMTLSGVGTAVSTNFHLDRVGYVAVITPGWGSTAVLGAAVVADLNLLACTGGEKTWVVAGAVTLLEP